MRNLFHTVRTAFRMELVDLGQAVDKGEGQRGK